MPREERCLRFFCTAYRASSSPLVVARWKLMMTSRKEKPIFCWVLWEVFLRRLGMVRTSSSNFLEESISLALKSGQPRRS